MRYFFGEQRWRVCQRVMMLSGAVVMIWMSVLTVAYAKSKPISINHTNSLGSLFLWRNHGEALAVRHRLMRRDATESSSAERKKIDDQKRLPPESSAMNTPKNQISELPSTEAKITELTSKTLKHDLIETEVTHITSGCALTLTWSLVQTRDQSRSSIKNDVKVDVSNALTRPRKMGRRSVKRFAQSRWGALSKKARGVQFSLRVPSKIQLDRVKWWGCGWSDELSEVATKSRNKPKATLPRGAKSTRAISPFSSQNKSRKPEQSLKIKAVQNQLILESERWAFGLVIDGSSAKSSVVQNAQDPQRVFWLNIPSKSDGATSQNQTPMKLRFRLYHSSPQWRPLKQGPPQFKGSTELKEWLTLLDFLSSADGVVDGLGRQGTTRQWAGLALLASIDSDQLDQLSVEWCEATLMGALRSLPSWPHPFRAYKRPLKHKDGRLFLPIALARYLLDHPQGKNRVHEFLKHKWSGQMISGMIRRHIQDLIGRGAFFANRPSQRHLIAVHPEPAQMNSDETLRYGYLESVVLMPRALTSIVRLLSEPHVRALVSAAVGLELRADKIQKRWKEKTREFFGRQIEVYEARRRVENWGRFLALDDPETPALNIKYNIKYYESILNGSPPALSGYHAFDLLWGQHTQDELNRLINSARPFPAGLVTLSGMLAQHSLPFLQELLPQSETLMIPTISISALWMLGLNRQLRRRWPYKIKAKLEDMRKAIWTRLTVSESSSLRKKKSRSHQSTTSLAKEPVQTTKNQAGQKRSVPVQSPSVKTQNTEIRKYQVNPWFSDQLSALDSIVASIKAPPPIQTNIKVDVRELR